MDEDNLKILNQYDEIDFKEMEKEFGNFYAPCFFIRVNGEDILAKGVEVNSISVNNSITAANTCSFSISNVFNPVTSDVRWIHDAVELGSSVEIFMGYGNKLKLMFLGVVTAQKVGFQPGSLPQLEITGQDYSHYMMKGIKSRTFGAPNAKCSQVVKEIVAEYEKLTSQGIQDLGDSVRLDDELKQETMSDYTFITNIAKKYFLEFFVSGKDVYFRTPPDKNSRIITLEYGRNLTSFSTEANITEQITRVEVRGWDARTRNTIKYTADIAAALNEPDTQKKRELLEKSYGNSATVVIHTPVRSEYEAEQLAISLLKGQLQKMVKGTAETVGIPAILAGRNINLKGLGTSFSKQYYITGSTHTINTSGYKTSFQVEESV